MRGSSTLQPLNRSHNSSARYRTLEASFASRELFDNSLRSRAASLRPAALPLPTPVSRHSRPRAARAVLADIVTKMKERTAAEKRPPPKMTEGDEDEDDDDEDDFEEAN